MIVGLGSDLIDIRRIEKTLARFSARFEERVFTVGEREKAKRREGAGPRVVASTYAKRFAAKEAFAKAVGTGFRNQVFMRDIEVANLASGQPTLKLAGGARQAVDRLIPEGRHAAIQLTLTDDYPIAQAIVIISAI